jgi:hypothetical protein
MWRVLLGFSSLPCTLPWDKGHYFDICPLAQNETGLTAWGSFAAWMGEWNSYYRAYKVQPLPFAGHGAPGTPRAESQRARESTYDQWGRLFAPVQVYL